MALLVNFGVGAGLPASPEQGVVYFNKTDKTIHLNGETYGLSEGMADVLNGSVKSVVFVPETNTLTVTQNDGTSVDYVISNASSTQDGLMSKEDKALFDTLNGDKDTVGSIKNQIDIAVTEVKNSSTVKDGDKVLVQDAAGISSVIGLNWNSDGKKIELTGVGSAVIASIDATDFVKDGILNSVSLVAGTGDDANKTFIHFEFNTDAGKQPLDLDVTGLIDVYLAGDGLELTDKKFAVKIDVASAYLSKSGAGLKVDGAAIKADIDAAVAAAKTVVAAKNSGHVLVTVANDPKTGSTITITEADIASDAALKAVTGQSGNAYVADASTNYLKDATSLSDADKKLDDQLNKVSTQLTWIEY